MNKDIFSYDFININSLFYNNIKLDINYYYTIKKYIDLNLYNTIEFNS